MLRSGEVFILKMPHAIVDAAQGMDKFFAHVHQLPYVLFQPLQTLQNLLLNPHPVVCGGGKGVRGVRMEWRLAC